MSKHPQNERLKTLVSELLTIIGEDPSREGLLKTPERFARALTDLTQGYEQSVEKILNGATFEAESSEMIVVKKIEFYSLCEHHILPFFGHAHVAYVPRKKIIGLSKIPRIVQMCARKLQVQERLTAEIAKIVQDALNPLGVACVVDARHMCMMMRGVQVQSSSMVTSSMTGCFLKNAATRSEFMNIIGLSS